MELLYLLLTYSRAAGGTIAGRLTKSSHFVIVRRVRKTTISFVMFLRLPVGAHGTTQFPINGYSLSLIFEYFSKICRENSSFIKIGQEKRVNSMKTNTRIYFWSHLVQFFLE